jgi:fluoride exporter
MQTYLMVALGGIVGANLRFVVSTRAAARWGTAFPYGTLLINVTGSFLLGIFVTLIPAGSTQARAFFATGFCGAYTTFSTFAFETVALHQRDDGRLALANALGSALLCIGAAAGGILLGQAIVG